MPLAAAAVLAGVAGCTMCPDLHDYSGPVPNGSAPQNDFRVRSNGILQIGGTPPPWPSVVKAGAARPQVEPVKAEPAQGADIADPEPLVADVATPAPASAGGSDVVRLSAQAGPAEGSVVGAGVDRGSVNPGDPASNAAGGAAAVGVADEASPAAGDERPRSLAEPAPKETPGWRSRR